MGKTPDYSHAFVGEDIDGGSAYPPRLKDGNNSSIQEIRKFLSETPDMEGISIEAVDRKHFRVFHKETGTELPFILPGIKEALEMKYLLARALVVQHTCMENKKLRDTCKFYPELSFDERSADVFIDNNPRYILRDTLVTPSESIEATVRWASNKYSPNGEVLPYAEAVATFLNQVKNKKK